LATHTDQDMINDTWQIGVNIR